MTRINVGIPPVKLSRQHLLAEHREIKRIPNMVKSGRANLENIPEKFCLGKGHVSFFYDKLNTLYWRYVKLYNECRRRGYRVQNYESCWDFYSSKDKCYDSPLYEFTEEDTKLIRDRLLQKDYDFYSKIL